MNEVEVKILGIDRKKVEGRLVSLGAVKTFDDEMHAVYLDLPGSPLQKSQDVLRLRREGPSVKLTYKKFVTDHQAKVRREFEVGISDFNVMLTILKSAGFSGWLNMRKHRTSYELDKIHFELDKYYDEYDFIPEFLEIEAADQESVFRAAGLLGFRKEDCKPWTALDLAEYYSRKGGV